MTTQELLFLTPVFQEKIWGGRKLEEEFAYPLPQHKTIGECWAISAHPNGLSTIKQGAYSGVTLDVLWQQHPELFGNPDEEVFPLLVKLIDASDDLSVQVHPDDAYGLAHEGELGKTECWYILSADPEAEIIYGHNATSQKQLEEYIMLGMWDQLFRRIKVSAGDFFYVPSGTLHAIGKGILLLETQQSSDTTYRVYDYDRVDQYGNQRELHLKESLEVIHVPHQDPDLVLKSISVRGEGEKIVYIDNEFFKVARLTVKGAVVEYQEAPYTLVNVLSGSGMIQLPETEQVYQLKKGDHFVIPNTVTSWIWQGSLEVMLSYPGQ